MKQPPNSTRILRAGLYERVSTDEQAMRGFSIDAQIDNLTEYCTKNGYKIVDHYTDEGISGAKPPLKRPALKRLIEDVKDGKIDIIIFTKLDRWFRSVQEYFKVQEILESNRVEWKAIHEDYDTTTANGRMAITIFLAIAQNEREKTAERIKVVFDHKRKNKEACFGGPHRPLGYMKKEVDGVVRLVKNPEEQQMMEDFWDIMLKYSNLCKAAKHINEVYGVHRSHRAWTAVMNREFYCGRYKGIDNYCEAYVTPEQWQQVQDSRTYKKTQKNRVYLFSGMIRCPECGRLLCSTYNTYANGAEYKGYRCRHTATNGCSWGHRIAEIKTENYLLEHIEEWVNTEIEKAEEKKRKPKPKPKTNVAALKEQLRRLNVAYMGGFKPDEEYLAEAAELKAAIAKAETDEPAEEHDVERLKMFLENDFKETYSKLSAEEKRRIWRGMIKEIVVEKNDVVALKFF